MDIQTKSLDFLSGRRGVHLLHCWGCNKSPLKEVTEPGSLTASLPLKIYHPIKKGSSSNHHFFRGINSLWNFRGVYVNPNFPTPIFLCPDESATDSPKEWPASVASDQKWSEGSRAALWWPESSVRPGPNWCCIFPSLKAVHRKSSKVFCLPTQQKASNFGVGGYCSSKHRIWVWPTI